MKCLSPIRLKTGNPEQPFNDVPCGKCASCMQNKRSHWSIRLQDELQYATSSAFITLTYSDEYFQTLEKNLDYHEHQKIIRSISKRDAQNFLKRFRKYDKNIGIRYYLVGEYGSKSCRPHYHLILFNHDHNKLTDTLSRSWTFGNTFIGSVTDASIHYVTGYVVTKEFVPKYLGEPLQKSFALMSRKPGLGFQKLEKMYEHYQKNPVGYVTSKGGQKISMPRFYKDKLYNQRAKEIIKNQIKDTDDVKTVTRRHQNNNRVLNNFSKNKLI